MNQPFLRRLSLSLLIQVLAAGVSTVAVSARPPSPAQRGKASGSATRSGPEIMILKVGRPVERELKADETHLYGIKVIAGQFLRAVVDQRGINVKVGIYDPGGKEVVLLNTSDGGLGRESVAAVVETSGVYYIAVRPVEEGAPAGRYEVRVGELRKAMAKDFKFMAAERSFAEADDLRAEGTAESLLKSIEKYLEAISLYRASGGGVNEGTALHNLGSVYDDLDEKEKALEAYGQALRLARSGGDRWGEAVTLNNICTVYDSRGERRKALDCYLEALSLRRAVADRAGEATTLSNIGAAYDGLGERPKALEYYEQSLQLTRVVGDKVGEGLTLNNIGKLYADMGEAHKALGYYLKALPILRHERNDAGVAATLTNIGAAYDFIGKREEAVKYFSEALPLYKKAGDRSGEAAVLNNMGSVYNGMGERQKALGYYQGSLDLSRSAGDHDGQAVTLHNIGTIYDSLGEKQKAFASIGEALKLYQASGDRAGEANALNSLGAVYDSLGEKQQALDHYKKALLLHETAGDRDGKATVLHNIGSLHASFGDKPEALESYEQSLQLRSAIGDRAGAALTLSNIGRVYGDMGDLQKALDYYFKALSLHREASDRDGEATAHNNLGTVYVSLNDKQKALDHFSQALLTFRDIGDRAGEATSLSNIGSTHHDSGDLQKALDAFAKVLQIRESLGDREGIATAHDNLGGVYSSSGENEEALRHFSEAVSIFKSLGDRGGEAVVLNNMGVIFWKSGDAGKALDYYSQSLRLRRSVGARAGEAMTLANIGVLYESSGEKQKALEWYGQSLSAFERNRAAATLEEVKTGLAESSAGTYRRVILLAQSFGRPEQAFDITERARARAFLDQIGNLRPRVSVRADKDLLEDEQRLTSEVESLEARLRQEQSKPAAARPAQVIEHLAERLAAARRRFEELGTRLKLTNREHMALRSIDTLSLPEIQKLLDKDTSLVSYYVTPEKTLAFVITRDSFQHVELRVKEAELRAAVAAFRAFANLSDTRHESLRQLNDWLIAPLKRYIRTPVLGVIPNGILHYLPFAALTDGKRFLGEQYTLVYLPSASVLPFIKQKDKPPGTRALVVAESRAEGRAVLQHVNIEAQAVADIYNTRALTDGSMSVTEFMKRAGDYSIVHIAAHAELNPSNPLFSHIVLGQGKVGSDRLTVNQVYGMSLDKTALVVLSACDTNLGSYSKGDDVVGLNRAFIYAGSPAVMASLWSVDDESTSELMQAFYANLKRGMGRAKALGTAQSAVRKRHPHPYYWAGFILTGSPDAGVSGGAPLN